MPYRDCKCGYEDLSLSNPICKYITPLDIKNAMTRRMNAKSKTAGHAAMKAISKHPINNAFMSEGVPLSDNIHGIYRMLPPEKLHTTDEGITEHMISSLSDLIGDDSEGTKVRERIDSVHHIIQKEGKRNSERDFPRSSNRNGFLKNTLVDANERRGNMFLFLCICHTVTIDEVLCVRLRDRGVSMSKMMSTLKLYLGMEEWFHEENTKEEVKASRPLIAKTIDGVKESFPRSGNGWNLPMHLRNTNLIDCDRGTSPLIHGHYTIKPIC